MSILRIPQAIDYPETDGQPMAENTIQYRWITTIREGVESMFPAPAEVFTEADLFWYPVEGHPEIVQAPDVLIAFGRPKGERGSYMQWLEGGIAPQVVFEVLSPGNRKPQMKAKLGFYKKYDVEEYYIYDPDEVDLSGYLRRAGRLNQIRKMHGWTSPRLGIRFDMSGTELTIYGPGGQRFLTMDERERERKQALQRADQALQLVDQVAQERDRLAQERDRLAQERDQVAQEREADRRRAERLAAQLRALGIEPPE